MSMHILHTSWWLINFVCDEKEKIDKPQRKQTKKNRRHFLKLTENKTPPAMRKVLEWHTKTYE